MPLNYSIAMMGNPMNAEDPKKAYAKAQISEELSLKDLSKLVANQTTVNRAAMRAVLKAQKAGQTTVDISKKPSSGNEDKPGGGGDENDNPLG